MSQPIRVLSIHSPVVQEAAKAVASLYSSTMLSRREINDLISACKDGNDIDYSPQMIPFATGTHYSRGLVHSGRRIACADELHKVLLSFPLHPSLPVLRKKINTAFCNIPPEAIVAWHATIMQDLAGAAVVGASTPRDAVAVAPVAGSSRQADTESAAIPLSGSSSGPADNNLDAVSESSPIDAGFIGAGDVVSSRVNDTSEAGVAALVSDSGNPGRTEGAVIPKVSLDPVDDIVDESVLAAVEVVGALRVASAVDNEGATRLSDQAGNTDHLSFEVAETDGLRGHSPTSEPLINKTVVVPLDPAPSPSSSKVSLDATEAMTPPASQVDDGSSDTSRSSTDSILGKRALPVDDAAELQLEVASEVSSQASPKRQKANWWSRLWF